MPRSDRDGRRIFVHFFLLILQLPGVFFVTYFALTIKQNNVTTILSNRNENQENKYSTK